MFDTYPGGHWLVAGLALAAPHCAGDRTRRRGHTVERQRGHRVLRHAGCAAAAAAAVPHMAMVHGAIYDAVNAIDGDYEGYLLTRGSPGGPTRRTPRLRRPPTRCC